jgi:hypothetical protein
VTRVERGPYVPYFPAVTEPGTGSIVPPGPRIGDAVGFGWRRVAQAVAEAMPVPEVERIWLFPPVRQEDREWGTAVVARRVQAGRLRVYTGSYGLVIRGRERGQGQVALEEVGETPDDILSDVIRGVQDRAGEADEPSEIQPTHWFPTDDDVATTG